MYVWLISAAAAALTRLLLVSTLEAARGSMLLETVVPILVGLGVALAVRHRIVSPPEPVVPSDDDEAGRRELAVRRMARFSRIAVVALTLLCIAELSNSQFGPGRWLTWLVLVLWCLSFARVVLYW